MPIDAPVTFVENTSRAQLLTGDGCEREQRRAPGRLAWRAPQVGARAHQHEENWHQERRDRIDDARIAWARRASTKSRSWRSSRISPAAEGADDGSEPDTPASHAREKAERQPDVASRRRRFELRCQREESSREVDSERQRAEQEESCFRSTTPTAAYDSPPWLLAGDACDNRQDQESQHIVDDRGAEDDARFGALRPAEILEHARRDADARGGRASRR